MNKHVKLIHTEYIHQIDTFFFVVFTHAIDFILSFLQPVNETGKENCIQKLKFAF